MLKFDNICKTFNPGTPDAAVVFQNFNLELEKGEFLAIVGSNGSQIRSKLDNTVTHTV